MRIRIQAMFLTDSVVKVFRVETQIHVTIVCRESLQTKKLLLQHYTTLLQLAWHERNLNGKPFHGFQLLYEAFVNFAQCLNSCMQSLFIES